MESDRSLNSVNHGGSANGLTSYGTCHHLSSKSISLQSARSSNMFAVFHLVP